MPRHAAATPFRGSYVPLGPWQIRGRRFRTVRRGWPPQEVTEFLDRVANDLAGVHAALVRSEEENRRIKEALRQWQSFTTPDPSGLVHR
jgi:DivIVA domain-containing protein